MKHILVAVDFSPDSKAALDWALSYIASTRGGLTILHVIHDPADDPGFYRRDENKELSPMATVAKEMMDEFLAGFKDKNIEAADKVLVEGLVPERILEVAEKIGADQIVMGCRGRKGIKKNLIGSNAESVVQNSPIPVTVVKTKKQKA